MDIAPESINMLQPEKEKQVSLHNGHFLLSPKWSKDIIIYWCRRLRLASSRLLSSTYWENWDNSIYWVKHFFYFFVGLLSLLAAKDEVLISDNVYHELRIKFRESEGSNPKGHRTIAYCLKKIQTITPGKVWCMTNELHYGRQEINIPWFKKIIWEIGVLRRLLFATDVSVRKPSSESSDLVLVEN